MVPLESLSQRPRRHNGRPGSQELTVGASAPNGPRKPNPRFYASLTILNALQSANRPVPSALV